MTDISADDISRYQAARKKQSTSPRTINMEIGSLRAILRKARLWANIQPDIRMLRVREEVGRALSDDEQHRLLAVCRASRSRSLYPAVLLSLHTGLRRSNFPDAVPAHYVFPSERYGLDGESGYADGKVLPYSIRPDVAIGSWKVAWTAARTKAGVACRWHDLRHTFVSKMAEGQASDATIMALAGHLSRKMMERYSHVRNEAKRIAISALDSPSFRESRSQQSSAPGEGPAVDLNRADLSLAIGERRRPS